MKELIEKYFDKLWPINRSITGDGLRKSFDILSELMPITTYEIASGTKVHDWEVPKEWNVDEAYIITPKGERIADVSVNNLHLMGYSIPFQGKMSFEDLDKHLYTLPQQPDAIPYITSYYFERWGFCITHNEYLDLDRKGEYEIKISSSLKDGSLTMGDAYLQGDLDEEIVFSSYLCHPSLASNELSGPLVLAMLYNEIKSIPNRKYSYRFILTPETIGTIAYLDQFGIQLKEKCIAGLIITCVGDNGSFTYKKSREEDSYINRICSHVLESNEHNNYQLIPFSPIGSDERQYCSPGYNLPFGSLMRTMYGKYDEYHTSLDNKDYISFEAMEQIVVIYLDIVKTMELDGYYINQQPYCEPQLGKRGLYPQLGDKSEKSDSVRKLMYLLNYSDGNNSVLDIAEKLSVSVLEMEAELIKLKKSSLLIEKKTC